MHMKEDVNTNETGTSTQNGETLGVYESTITGVQTTTIQKWTIKTWTKAAHNHPTKAIQKTLRNKITITCRMKQHKMRVPWTM